MEDLSDEAELISMVEEILEEYPFSTERERIAQGIAQQVINRGYSSLTVAQKQTFDSVFHGLLWDKQDQKDKAHRAYLLSRDCPP